MLGFDALGKNALGPPDLAPPAAYELTADAASFTFTGIAAGLAPAYRVAIGAGALSEAGQAVTLRAERLVAADAGSFTFSGIAAGLVPAYRVSLAAGSFTLSGQPVGLAQGFSFAAETGVFAFSGVQTVNLHLPVAGTSFAVTGGDAYLFRKTLLQAVDNTIVRTLSPALTIRGGAISSGLSTFDPDVFEHGTFDVSDLGEFIPGHAARAEYGDRLVNADVDLDRAASTTSPRTQLHDLAVA